MLLATYYYQLWLCHSLVRSELYWAWDEPQSTQRKKHKAHGGPSVLSV